MAFMRTPEEHTAAIARAVPARGQVRVPLADAAGRTLAVPVTADVDSPRFDNSQMDGYALSDAHVAATPGTFTVGKTLPAGTDPDQLYPDGLTGQVAPIMTGAKIPRGTAAVVPVEACRPDRFPGAGERIEITAAVQPGQYIRPAGSDIRAGDPLLRAGDRISPVAVGVLAGQDITEVTVVERHRVIICTGGAEIGTGHGAGAAAIPDSNGPMLAALCARAGIEVAAHIRTDDDPARLAAELAAVAERLGPTAIITSGGISAGQFEVVRQVLGSDGWFGHVDQQPGGPQGLARFHGIPVICLPGNPVSTLVSFRIFVAPLLGTAPAPVVAVLAEDAPGLPGRDQFLRGRHTGGQAAPVGGAGSHLLAQALGADCLILIPAGGLPAGQHVTVYPFD